MIDQTIMCKKAIVVLNNTAVTLLQRQRYGDAEATFKDAVDLISCIRDGQRRPMVVEKLPIFLNRATRRIARSTNLLGASVSVKASKFALTVLEKDANNTNEILSAIPDSCRGYVYKFELDEDSIDTVVDTAILLLNFSVAIRIRAQAHRRNSLLHTTTEKMNLACKMLTAAHTILNKHVSASYSSEKITHLHVLEQQRYVDTLQVSMIVALDLILFSPTKEHRTNQNTQGNIDCFFELMELRSKLSDAKDSFLNLPLQEVSRMTAGMA
jgi:hypothetical protein